ncbi:glycoside hydrolase N-terminal domain-containing protein [Dysgonomonas sp. ZJ709]|uniref:glycoside hydrolase family 95 protein n=1 Tax=Dysgonomonas sp. ZJ709 TaxID=2709797 RepID=UPI0013EABA50|nr:glycoside hydrolase family 95 protein [Dysgonomonas sp. ZJ709]
MKIYSNILTCFILSCFCLSATAKEKPYKLWYDKPASRWEACVPLGNGRLGAMPDGGVSHEKIVLNDITLWSGSPQNADNPEAFKHLPTIQKLLLEGKNISAQEVMGKNFICLGKGSGLGNGANVPYGSFQLVGDLLIDYNYGIDSSKIQVQNYYRDLVLDDAIAKTEFSIDDTKYTREYFASFDNDVIIIHYTANGKNKINFSASLDRPENFAVKTEDNQLQMSGQLNNGVDGNGMKYITRLEIKPKGGRVIAKDKSLQVENADEATIYISIATDYKNPSYLESSQKKLEIAQKVDYNREKIEHTKNFQTLFGRADINIGGIDKYDLPTDKRLEAFATSPNDNGLISLYFQYGRYLMISSTRPGLLPPNLQGLWANEINTPWNGDYHLNINIQMNHFPLNVTNLGALNGPFFDLVKSIVPSGEKTAKAYYSGDGWVAHVITNIWGYTSPGEEYTWGSFNSGSAWLCQMLWNHYEYTKDKEYLKKLYPIIKGSAEFYLSTMIKEPSHGWLVTAPSSSPENAFIMPTGQQAHVCMGPTMDNQIVRYLFSKTIEASTELNKDEKLRKKLKDAIVLLPPNQIGKDGRLLEWLEEYKEVEPKHRHISHLWGLYPGDEINSSTPELQNAARATINGRGEDGTGWSLAWRMNFWARLGNGERAFASLQKLLSPTQSNSISMNSSSGTYDNLFCAHPPFQIDGNFGGTAGIAEMLVQSHQGYIELLPALPKGWKDGNFSGLCVRGNGEIDLDWTDSKPNKMNIKAHSKSEFKIKIPAGISKTEITKKGKTELVNTNDEFMIIPVEKDEIVSIQFI